MKVRFRSGSTRSTQSSCSVAKYRVIPLVATSALMSAALSIGGVGSVAASAHVATAPDAGVGAAQAPAAPADDDSAEHAAQDLVGTPISQIEKTTNANADRIAKQTGKRPGRATPELDARNGISVMAVSTDPGVVGKWGSVIDTQVVPVFTAVLPNGKVLIWDSVGDNATETYPNQTFTRAMVWTPSTNTFKRVDVQGSNIFCAGFAHLANGNVLVAGGNADAALNGTVQTHIFNWQTETWTRGADMAGARWYPSVTEMANGEATIVGGGPAVSEVYQTNGALRTLPGFTAYATRLYPFMISRPDTQLSLFGPYTTAYTVNVSGLGAITATATRDAISRDYGSFATYAVGKSLVVGGGSVTEGGVANVPTKTAVVVNNNSWGASTMTSAASMQIPRRQHNATVLADGSVLATGGETSTAQSGLVDLGHAATAAERWDPATNSWTLLSNASRVRQYHSTAVLLPDGRVMTGGGGICGDCMTYGYLEKNIEYFTPPYLYKHDGSGQLATRPTIATAPTSISVNTAFTMTSSQAASIRKVGLVKLGDATHGVDQGQRYIPLSYTVSGATLTVTGPPNGGVAPPGYYMLFVTDAAGVPSAAKILQVAKGPSPLGSAVTNTGAAKCIDVPNSSIAQQVFVWTYGCNGTNAQALTRLPNDSTLRVMGNCLDVPNSSFVSGRTIWTYGCNGTGAQRWQFRTDGTIRPLSNTALCLATASVANGAAISIATCNGTSLQKWTW